MASGRRLAHLRDGGARELLSVAAVTGFNDIEADVEGGVLAGALRYHPFRGEDPVPGAVWRLRRDGEAEELFGGVMWPNGIGLSPDGTTVYVSDYQEACVLAWDGGSEARVHARAPDGASCDGLALDAEGGLWVAPGPGRGDRALRPGRGARRGDGRARGLRRQRRLRRRGRPRSVRGDGRRPAPHARGRRRFAHIPRTGLTRAVSRSVHAATIGVVEGIAHTASVAAEFEPRIRAWEDEHLSDLATRSYPAIRERPEEDCSLRTPFQRDRDRIVHSKAFRRLKHKTQVFVAPQGDHYRTRLTHTLEVTQVSRTVARALRLNEDLVEAIGLGHDLGHPPFGHIGEAALDACLSERFGTGFRHYEHSLRVVDVIEAPQPTEAVRDGILRHSGRASEPATLEGAIVRLVDRIAYINHDIDDALRAGVIAPADLPARGDRGARRERARGGSTRSCTTSSSTPPGPARSSRARRSARRWRGCASSCSSACTWARRRGASTRASTRSCARCSSTTSSTRRPGVEGAGRARARDGLHRRDDRPLLHPRVRGAGRPAVVRLMARYTPDSKERVRDAVDMIDLVSARTELRRAGANRYEGLCPFHEERTPSFGIDPVKKVYHCFGCGAGGDVFTFVQETEGLDFGGAMELLADRYGVELERERGGSAGRGAPRAPRAADRAARAHGGVLRALPVGVRRGGGRPRVPDRAGGSTRRRCERFRVGYAPKPWDHMVLRWRANGFSDEELICRRGWPSAAARAAGSTTPSAGG